MFGSKDLLFSAEKYNISRSLRLRASASAYLNRTPASASNRTTWTLSFWAKKGLITANSSTFTGAQDDNNRTTITFGSASDNIAIANVVASASTTLYTSTAVFRDPSAWYHCVVKLDTTQATAADRLRIYVNNVEQAGTFSYPAQNATLYINNNVAHWIGRNISTAGTYFDGYLADFILVDGQALTPSSFGFYDNFGIWQPKSYTGAYGTNGFYLNFSDTTSTTTLCNDYSGNGNNFTPNNISVTAGVTYDSMIDVPTNYLDGSTGRGNYCVLNPISTLTTASVVAGNLQFTSATAGHNAIGSIGMSDGKWYWEAETSAGTTQARATVYGTSAATYYSFAANNTVYGFRFDAAAGTFEQTANGSTWTSIATGLTSGPYFPYFNNNGTTSKTIAVNFGQRPFSYTPPSGYLALNTQNMTAPTIPNGAQYMAAVTYTGNGTASTAITASSSNSGNNPLGVTFQPDLVWIKSRSATTNNNLFDTIRTATNYLISNSTAANASNANTLTAFNTTGFTLGTDAGSIGVNVNAATYVAWEWNAGSGSSVSNTSGSITSTVSANTTAGFSVVGYTGTGVNATVGHGLGVAPSMIIVKNKGAIGNWTVYHTRIGATNILQLNTTVASTAAATVWNNTAPDNTKFSIGTAAGVNTNTDTYIAYCFAAVDGYSAFGSYTGNGSADGPFIYTGFRPRWIMIKRTDAVSTWLIEDTSRNTYNLTDLSLSPETSGVEITQTTTGNPLDILSSGFKCRGSGASSNASAGTFVYAAFAENPFKYSRAR